ncbi:MAG: Bacterioopsin transcriptional activator [Candidatus Methanofastidiosum methylothiophilum]|uniref:Bacterioopsin transcriptional activator n=1 Tax=Candidatus Methanofastidiosum methylothiophilum TaxID=1705564 RepID=A0A150JAY5_9EURY|nr:MAG: Bacterioopsin transcriptional activator [Candidatus Methanofastidiosum methylthiophilus]NMC76079.1 PAS domain S-box protein [Candidatus Methanofastidiosa archaeon]
MEILVVEDNEEIGYLQERILTSNNYIVTRASNGKEALELLANKKYDMIISDILMPEMDGFQLCKTLKSDSKTKNIPFVFYSANYTENKDREFALKLGADLYIETPIEYDVFIKIINDYFDKLKEGKIKVREYLFEKENNVEKIYSERLARQLEKKIILLEKKITENNELTKKIKENEERYKLIFDNTEDIVCLMDLNGTITFMSKSIEVHTGYKDVDLIGKNIKEILSPRSYTEAKKRIELRFKGIEELPRYEIEVISKNNELIPFEISTSPIYVNGELSSISIVAREISKRKLMEESIKRSEKKFRSYVENAPDGIFIADSKGNYIDVNKAACEITGYTREELLKINLIDLIPDEDKEKAANSFAKVVNEGKSSVEISFLKKGEEKRYWIVEAVKLSDNEFLGFAKDITERKKLEEEKTLLLNAVNQSPAIVIISDDKGNIEYVNPKFFEITGYNNSEVIGKNVSFLSGEPFSKIKHKEIWGIISSGKDWHGEFKNKKKNGDSYWELASIAPFKTQGGKITHYVKVAEDITYRKLAEKELQEREETLRSILSAAPIGINLLKDRKFVWSNKSMEEITGYSMDELLGKSPRLLYLSDEEYERVGRILYKIPREKEFEDVETKCQIKNGKILDLYIRASPLDVNDISKGYINLVMDITENIKTRKQLDENLEYFAHLIDHIRNPLAIISGFVQVNVGDEKTKDVVIRQVARIEKLLRELDQGWMDTEETRKFLKNYI